MARIVFDLPPRFLFSTEVQVYIGQVNYGGHLDNAQLLSLVSEARVRFFQSNGWTEMNAGGAGIVVGDMLAQYKSEAFHGEVLRVDMTAADFNRYGMDLVFRITAVADAREVARGKSGIVFVDKDQHRATPIPASVLQRLQDLLAQQT